jgi:hypothetical protein
VCGQIKYTTRPNDDETQMSASCKENAMLLMLKKATCSSNTISMSYYVYVV